MTDFDPRSRARGAALIKTAEASQRPYDHGLFDLVEEAIGEDEKVPRRLPLV